MKKIQAYLMQTITLLLPRHGAASSAFSPQVIVTARLVLGIACQVAACILIWLFSKSSHLLGCLCATAAMLCLMHFFGGGNILALSASLVENLFLPKKGKDEAGDTSSRQLMNAAVPLWGSILLPLMVFVMLWQGAGIWFMPALVLGASAGIGMTAQPKDTTSPANASSLEGHWLQSGIATLLYALFAQRAGVPSALLVSLLGIVFAILLSFMLKGRVSPSRGISSMQNAVFAAQTALMLLFTLAMAI